MPHHYSLSASSQSIRQFKINKVTQNLLITVKCLNIGTPKITNFPFVPNGKLLILGVPIFEHFIIRLLCAQILGHLKIINFTFGTNGKFIAFRCPNTKAYYGTPYFELRKF